MRVKNVVVSSSARAIPRGSSAPSSGGWASLGGRAILKKVTIPEILEQLRALPTRDRLRIVEQVVHEVAEAAALAQTPRTPGTPLEGLWSDVDDAEYEEFQRTLAELRARPARVVDASRDP